MIFEIDGELFWMSYNNICVKYFFRIKLSNYSILIFSGNDDIVIPKCLQGNLVVI